MIVKTVISILLGLYILLFLSPLKAQDFSILEEGIYLKNSVIHFNENRNEIILNESRSGDVFEVVSHLKYLKRPIPFHKTLTSDTSSFYWGIDSFRFELIQFQDRNKDLLDKMLTPIYRDIIGMIAYQEKKPSIFDPALWNYSIPIGKVYQYGNEICVYLPEFELQKNVDYFLFWYKGSAYKCIYKGHQGVGVGGIAQKTSFRESILHVRVNEKIVAFGLLINQDLSPYDFILKYESGEYRN